MMQLSTLANGLKVASRHLPGSETAALVLHADAGARHEPARLNGIAHLFEHMVFKGAGGRSARALSEAIEDVGGELNAATDRDSTAFTASVLPEHVDLGLELIADMIRRPHFDPAELLKEKQVVLQELGEARDTPNDIIFDDLQAAAFADQALGRSVLGEEDSIEAITADDLHAWRESCYRAGSMMLVAAGKVDHDLLVALAEERLGDLPDGEAPAPEGAHFTGGTRVGRVRADQAHIAIGLAAPGLFEADYHAARLFADVLGGGAASRLFHQVREERGLAYTVWASAQPWRDAGLLSIYAATARKDGVATAALLEEVAGACAQDVTARELERAKCQARASLLMYLESPWGQANYLARQLSTYGRLVEPAEAIARVQAVSLDEVRAAGAKMLAGPRARATIGFPAARAA